MGTAKNCVNLHSSKFFNNSSYQKMPLYELLKQAAKYHPQKTAIIYLDKELSYEKLDELSDRFAAGLKTLNVTNGDCVALFLPNSLQFVISYYGILKAGAVVTAINPLHRELEVGYQLANSEAKAVVTIDSLYPIVNTVWQKTNLRTVILYSSNKSSQIKIKSQPFTKPAICDFQSLLNTRISSLRIDVNFDTDLAALQYTGGTTGTAKGAMLTHENLVANAVAFAIQIKGIPEKDVFLSALPLSHIYGLTTSLNVPVVLAAKIVLLPRFESSIALDAIQQHRISVFCAVPTMYNAILANPKLSRYCLSSLRVCISGASPLPPQIQKKFIQTTGELLIEGYGLTEASPVTHCNPVDESLRTVTIGSIGLPLPSTEAKIVDTDTGTKTLSVGEVGELIIRGPQIMKGYWKNPQETAIALRDGWLYTGDLASKDVNGYFYLVGRKKELIKYNGYSVYPREIEDLLYEHPAVKLCAVIGKPDKILGEVPKAFIVLKDGLNVSEEEIKFFINTKLAPYKALRLVEFRKDLPLSAAGKISKQALKSEEAKISQF
jgi:long-chain acyl-CoA synthetase